MVQCDPKDRFEVILECDNSQSEVTVSCQYQKKIGTSYSYEITEMFNIHYNVGQTLKVS